MWIAGADYYGKVDRIPGVCHVRTRFIHVMFVPFVPTDSYLIVEAPFLGGVVYPANQNPVLTFSGSLLLAEAETPSGGVIFRKIRLSAKSIAFAWLRSVLVILIVALLCGVLEIVFDGRPNRFGGGQANLAFASVGVGAVMGALYWLTLPLSKPWKSRRQFLIKLLPNPHNVEWTDWSIA